MFPNVFPRGRFYFYYSQETNRFSALRETVYFKGVFLADILKQIVQRKTANVYVKGMYSQKCKRNHRELPPTKSTVSTFKTSIEFQARGIEILIGCIVIKTQKTKGKEKYQKQLDRKDSKPPKDGNSTLWKSVTNELKWSQRK